MSAYQGPRCQACNGPCWQWKGDVWGYTCAACIAKHQDDAAARADARDKKVRARNIAKLFRDKDSAAVS